MNEKWIQEQLDILNKRVSNLEANSLELPNKVRKLNTTRWVYKQKANSEVKVKVGVVDLKDNVIELYPPRNTLNKNSKLTNLYYNFFIVGTEQEVAPYYTIIEPSNHIEEIVVKEFGTERVLGYINDEGKTIYYDQYL
jgi:hypothetical protein